MIVRPELIKEVVLTGGDLTVEKVIGVARFGAAVAIDPEALERMQESREAVEEIVREEKTVYGINTGFGEFSKITVDSLSIRQLQKNLILSHCCGTGAPVSDETVRALMLLRANALCVGYSGIRPKVVETLVAMINKGVHPIVPEKGSLGASGDLAPLSHMALPLIGLGEARYEGRRMEGGKAMADAGLEPMVLCAKEGLALINGTQMMTAHGVLAFYDALSAARLADINGAVSLEALTGLKTAFDERVHAVRPHRGQCLSAKNIRLLTEGSENLESCQNDRVQDAYALRCMPQVHGAVRDTLDHVRRVLEIELNSVTDNPIVFKEDGTVISGGNFHGEPMALAFDFLGIAAAELASISERRLERLVNPTLNNGLQPFLTKFGGLHSGYMICQYSAASLVSENKVLAHPASVDSIPSSANQEDHVSMGTTAARKAVAIVDNTLSVLAFELMAAVQGLDLRGRKPSDSVEAVRQVVRRQVPFLEEDREIRLDIEAINRLVRSGEIQSLASELIGDFE